MCRINVFVFSRATPVRFDPPIASILLHQYDLPAEIQPVEPPTSPVPQVQYAFAPAPPQSIDPNALKSLIG